jgi:hypothetical protein
MKLNTVLNTPASKELLEEEVSCKVPMNSPPEHATPRTNIFIDKNCKSKIAMVNLGKAKLMIKNQRNCLKPPKKCYTINSNRNSDSDSSFTSLGQLGFKNAGHDQITPHHVVRNSFEIRSTVDFLNNTDQNLHRKPDKTYEGFNHMFNTTHDVRDADMNNLCDKGMALIFNNLVSKGVPNSITNMMTMQSQYKSKVPNNN